MSGKTFRKLSRISLVMVWMLAWFAPAWATSVVPTCVEVDGVIECDIEVTTHGQGPELTFSISEDQTEVTIITYTSLTCDTFEQSAELGFADPYLYLYSVEPHPELEDTFSNTLITQDDDGASHNDDTNFCWDAAISTTLDIGEYVLVADSYDESTVGTYSMDITGGQWDILETQPEPEPTPTPEPDPELEPTPEPSPEPSPTPLPNPPEENDLEEQPEPTLEPEPSPTPEEQPEPTPTPEPEPDPSTEEESLPDQEEEEQFEYNPQPEPEPLPEISPTPPPFVIILPDDFVLEEELDEEDYVDWDDIDYEEFDFEEFEWEELEIDELPEIDEDELLLLEDFEEEFIDEEPEEELEELDTQSAEEDFIELLPEEEEPEIILEEYFQSEDLEVDFEEIDFDEREAIEEIIEETGDEELAEDLLEVLDEEVTEEEITELLDNESFEAEEGKVLDQVVQAVQSADTDVRLVFEEKVDIFAGAVDEYVPTGSTIDVEDRRTVVAATAVVATTQAVGMAMAKPSAPQSAPTGGGAGSGGPSARRRSK